MCQTHRNQVNSESIVVLALVGHWTSVLCGPRAGLLVCGGPHVYCIEHLTLKVCVLAANARSSVNSYRTPAKTALGKDDEGGGLVERYEGGLVFGKDGCYFSLAIMLGNVSPLLLLSLSLDTRVD